MQVARTFTKKVFFRFSLSEWGNKPTFHLTKYMEATRIVIGLINNDDLRWAFGRVYPNPLNLKSTPIHHQLLLLMQLRRRRKRNRRTLAHKTPFIFISYCHILPISSWGFSFRKIIWKVMTKIADFPACETWTIAQLSEHCILITETKNRF